METISIYFKAKNLTNALSKKQNVECVIEENELEIHFRKMGKWSVFKNELPCLLTKWFLL